MAESSGTPQWISAWKTRAQNRRQWLAQVLARQPTTPAQTWRREMLLTKAQSSVQRQKSWADAYQEHIHELANVLSKPFSGGKAAVRGSPSVKGSVGDT
jgi:uncharacterized protein YllA (UPF0747 family)